MTARAKLVAMIKKLHRMVVTAHARNLAKPRHKRTTNPSLPLRHELGGILILYYQTHVNRASAYGQGWFDVLTKQFDGLFSRASAYEYINYAYLFSLKEVQDHTDAGVAWREIRYAIAAKKRQGKRQLLAASEKGGSDG